MALLAETRQLRVRVRPFTATDENGEDKSSDIISRRPNRVRVVNYCALPSGIVLGLVGFPFKLMGNSSGFGTSLLCYMYVHYAC